MPLADTGSNDLIERIVRVEEAITHQIEMSRLAFSEMNKRFDILIAQMENHYAQIDKRTDQVGSRINQSEKRFDQTEKRFESMQQQMDRCFDALIRRMDHFIVWSFSDTVATRSIVISALKVWS